LFPNADDFVAYGGQMNAIVKLVVAIVITVLIGYPIAALVVHGLDPGLWPPQVIAPNDWFGGLVTLQIGRLVFAYWQMMIGRSPAFGSGGFFIFVCVWIPALFWMCLRFFSNPLQQLRDSSGIYGVARFATSSELASMNEGLELGIDPKTGVPVRVKVQGTLLTIAPPRRGKTSGLLIPNLAFPELQSWAGPAVVLDSKGEVYRAVADRRRLLGRKVVCLDPLGLVDGEDRWNPLLKVDPSDILYLQRTALALLPESTGGDESSAYFRNRAVDLLTGAMIVAIAANRRTPSAVQRLLTHDVLFAGELKKLKGPAVVAALDILQADPKTRDPIKSTAAQAFQWLADQRLRYMVEGSTFDLDELSSGEVDLFIAVPPEYKRLLAPFLRWLLSDLFASIRRNRPKERIIVFVDEAAALGKFDEILTAAGELPGYGASLWTLWQDRSQLVSLYGETGAATLLNTAEVVTVFNIPAVDPDESERWSRTVGDYTALVTTTSSGGEGKGKTTTSRAPQAARLMTPSALITMPQDELIAFINAGDQRSNPIRLRKTVAHVDPRFRRLIQSAPPVGKTG
jgi:type IV secretion system protein VirD4